jgi:hypothetical protein
VRPPRPAELVITTAGGNARHPLPEGADVCMVIARLAPVVPVDATWYVDPTRPDR